MPLLAIPKLTLLADYATHAYHFYNTCSPYLQPVRSTLSTLQARSYPIIMPYVNAAAVKAQDSPGIISVGVLLLFVLIALQILNVLRRIMMWWIRLLWWATIGAVLVLFASIVYQRGPEKTVEDAVRAARHLSEVWWREYRRWEGYQNAHGGGGRRT
jgi:ABC-type multidrug transport system fused ATPase/permease subunit